MANISGFGVRAWLQASSTFPQGFAITQYADDTDVIDFQSVTIAETAKGVNGTKYSWSTANPILCTIAVGPATVDDNNLSNLFQSNFPAPGGENANDVITLSIVYPDNSTGIYTGGSITDGTPGKSIAQSGRLKSQVYNFSFENYQTTGPQVSSVI